MQDDEAITIAREIYKNHKVALDFIFENKPDRMLEVSSSFDSAVQNAGYTLGSPGKSYCRFLTPKLASGLPKSTSPGWKYSESFLFEILYYESKVYLKCVISPGDQEFRDKLIKALKTVEGAKSSKGKLWSTVHNHTHRINVYDEKYDDLAVLKEDIEGLLEKEKVFIHKIEAAILNQLEKG